MNSEAMVIAVFRNASATHPGVVLTCFWMGKHHNWFHWKRRVDWHCLPLNYHAACISLLDHLRQENAQVTLAPDASFRPWCKSKALWLLSISQMQSEILVVSATENTKGPWLCFQRLFPPIQNALFFYQIKHFWSNDAHVFKFSFIS